MTDSTNNSFEEQWQHAFDDAELTPPESVWEKIELGLKPENTLPSKTNFGNKPYYFLGGIFVGLLGVFLWFSNVEKESQIIEKEEVKKSIEMIGGGINGANTDVNHGVTTKHWAKKPLSVSSQTTNETKKIVEVVGEDIYHEAFESTPEEILIRILTDSVEMIEPLATKSIHSEIENPTISLPTDQTSYYVKPTPKSQKKSILNKIKISAGVGIYQQ